MTNITPEKIESSCWKKYEKLLQKLWEERLVISILLIGSILILIGFLCLRAEFHFNRNVGDSRDITYLSVVYASPRDSLNRISTLNSPASPQIFATWYDRDNCLNCHPELITASGIKLPEDGFYAAYDNAPLNSFVEVRYKNKSVVVKIIDRVGDNTIIDLLPMAFSSLENLAVGKMSVQIIN